MDGHEVDTCFQSKRMKANTDKIEHSIFHQKGIIIPKDTNIIFNNYELGGYQNPSHLHALKRV
jgi:hypothetical protein